MKSKAIIPLIGLGLLSALVAAVVNLRAHAGSEAHADQTPAVPTQEAPQEAPENPALPMKRLEGSDRAEILEAIKKQQLQDANNSDNTSEPASTQIPGSQPD